MKRLIAFSSVGHMGFVMLGLAALTDAGVQGAALQMFNHGVVTGAMFLAVGQLYEDDGDGYGYVEGGYRVTEFLFSDGDMAADVVEGAREAGSWKSSVRNVAQ